MEVKLFRCKEVGVNSKQCKQVDSVIEMEVKLFRCKQMGVNSKQCKQVGVKSIHCKQVDSE